MKPILDISEFQPYVTYSLAAKDISGVIIRVGGTGYTYLKQYEDSMFEAHYNGFHKQGTPIGVYFLASAIDDEGVDKEVELTLRRIAGKKIELPVYYDVEISRGMGPHGDLTKEERTRLALRFCNKIKEKGYKAGIYTGVSFKNMIDFNAFDYLWLAQYFDYLQYDGEYDMWQYTSNGIVQGISGRVDLNKPHERKKEIITVSEPTAEPERPKPATNQNEEVYTVKAGDTLLKIAETYGMNYLVLARYNDISNPNLILVGQKIRIPNKTVTKTEDKATEPKKEEKKDYILYRVLPNDTVSGLAVKYQTSISKIVRDNHLADPNLIYVNQQLKIYPGVK